MDLSNEFGFIAVTLICGTALIYSSCCMYLNLNKDAKFLRIRISLLALMGLIGYICFLASPIMLIVSCFVKNYISLAIATGIAYVGILIAITYGILKSKKKGK